MKLLSRDIFEAAVTYHLLRSIQGSRDGFRHTEGYLLRGL